MYLDSIFVLTFPTEFNDDLRDMPEDGLELNFTDLVGASSNDS